MNITVYTAAYWTSCKCPAILLFPVSSVHSSERLEKEKDELRVALEDALQKLQEQHQNDLDELEQRLQTFYQAEWDKVHLTYQEEADKCKTLMQQQVCPCSTFLIMILFGFVSKSNHICSLSIYCHCNPWCNTLLKCTWLLEVFCASAENNCRCNVVLYNALRSVMLWFKIKCILCSF